MPFYRSHILVCNGTPCILKGSRAIQAALIEEIKKKGLDKEIKVVETGCLGISEHGPVMVVYPEGTTYCKVTVTDIPTIVDEHLLKGTSRRTTRLQREDLRRRHGRPNLLEGKSRASC